MRYLLGHIAGCGLLLAFGFPIAALTQSSPTLKIALIAGYKSVYPTSGDQEKFAAFAVRFAKQHGYTLLIDAGSADDTAPYVLYAAKSTDISRAVTKAFSAGTTETAGSPLSELETVDVPTKDARIATIEFQKAVTETEEFQRLVRGLRAKYEPQTTQLATQTEEIDQLKMRIEKTQLTDAERQSLQRTIDEKELKKDGGAHDAQNAFMADLGKLYDSLASKFYDSESNYASKNGYTIVLDKSVKPHEILWFADGIAAEDLMARRAGTANSDKGLSGSSARPQP